ncbi:MAG TPA: phosphoribosylanthranilate isomerase [Tepidisphaeraceae bacterium]|jgi:phosphoribosylanthranilate isomerase|nr:phosphoribosylanthranilate isomerase [Tepidisphaeraceae bacterium]
MRTRPRIKICCIASLDEAKMAIDAGASALGLVSAMPSGPGPISEEEIAKIAPRVPPGVATFLLTCKQRGVEIVNQLHRTGCNTIQLCDELEVDEYALIRRACPSVRIVQVIHVQDHDSLEEAKAVWPHVDAILLDSGRPRAATKELGGTGRVHDWQTSRRIRDAVSVPVYLAGGLRTDNVRQAIEEVKPFGLDLCTGVRTDGKLDFTKLNAFMRTALQ